MNPSEIEEESALAVGGALYGAGYGVLVAKPYTQFAWSSYESAITEQVGLDAELRSILSDGGITINQNRSIAPNSISNVKGTIAVNKFNGLQAEMAEAALV